jgi:hypothetical protein
MSRREEEKPMEKGIHHWEKFVLALFEHTLAALVNVACGSVLPLN